MKNQTYRLLASAIAALFFFCSIGKSAEVGTSALKQRLDAAEAVEIDSGGKTETVEAVMQRMSAACHFNYTCKKDCGDIALCMYMKLAPGMILDHLEHANMVKVSYDDSNNMVVLSAYKDELLSKSYKFTNVDVVSSGFGKKAIAMFESEVNKFGGVITVDGETNSIHATAPSNWLEGIESFVRAVDKPQARFSYSVSIDGKTWGSGIVAEGKSAVMQDTVTFPYAESTAEHPGTTNIKYKDIGTVVEVNGKTIETSESQSSLLIKARMKVTTLVDSSKADSPVFSEDTLETQIIGDECVFVVPAKIVIKKASVFGISYKKRETIPARKMVLKCALLKS